MSDHLEPMRQRLRELRTQFAPSPWHPLPPFAVGGLVAVGFTSDSTAVLVASSYGGRSLYDCRSAAQVARDRDDNELAWTSPGGISIQGIGPVANQVIPVAGLSGGGLSTGTRDGWSCKVVAPDWPIERVVLEPPGCDVAIEKFAEGCVQVADSLAVEIRAAGFSRDGRTFVVATSADISLWTREPMPSFDDD